MAEYQSLARFRRALRVFLHFSETAAREAGLTPAQHQLMLAVKGWEGARPPSIGDLAATLLLRHHSTVELVSRGEEAGMVVRRPDDLDGRRQRVHLTARGEEKLARLSALHREELRRFRRRTAEDLLPLG
ncbi:MAG TPA: MarR family winged helix-turn-helix transcriptional regulator [Acidimicrobiales bacterium]